MLKPFKLNDDIFIDLAEVQKVKKHERLFVAVSFKDGTTETVEYDSAVDRNTKFDEIYKEIFQPGKFPKWAKEQAQRLREKEHGRF